MEPCHNSNKSLAIKFFSWKIILVLQGIIFDKKASCLHSDGCNSERIMCLFNISTYFLTINCLMAFKRRWFTYSLNLNSMLENSHINKSFGIFHLALFVTVCQQSWYKFWWLTRFYVQNILWMHQYWLFELKLGKSNLARTRKISQSKTRTGTRLAHFSRTWTWQSLPVRNPGLFHGNLFQCLTWWCYNVHHCICSQISTV